MVLPERTYLQNSKFLASKGNKVKMKQTRSKRIDINHFAENMHVRDVKSFGGPVSKT